MDKHKKYRLHNVAKGKCPHCGKPCAPFYECETRRFAKRLSHALRWLEKAGIVRRIVRREPEGGWIFVKEAPLKTRRSGGPKDGRGLPRLDHISRERLQAICDWANEAGFGLAQ